MQVPPQLNYNQLQTKAFFSVFKQWPIQPIANGGQYWPGQLIRIFFNALTQGVMDPYRSHLQIVVSCDINSMPVGLLQVDNSAQSFINQLLISSKNRQIQRIVEYGVLAAYLNDIGISQLYSEGKNVQGLGYSNIDNYASIYTSSLSSTSVGQFRNDQGSGNVRTVSSPGTIFPTIPTKYNYRYSWGLQDQATSLLSGAFRGHVSPLNMAWISDQITQVWDYYQYFSGTSSANNCQDSPLTAALLTYGYVNNVRAQYLAANLSNEYIDTTTSYSKYQVQLPQSVMNNQWPAKFTDGMAYQIQIPDTVGYQYEYQGLQPNYQAIPNITSLQGFTTLYSPNFAKGVRQPFISPTVPQAQMLNGLITPSKFCVQRRTFKIPLISSCIGLLIPQSQFVLLPIRSLNDLLVQITIDPYAMFTSGYNDISQFDNFGMGLMQQRNFTIERVEYKLHTYQFWNPQMDQYLKVSLTTGIAINTKYWQMGNQYQIQNSQSITNSWPVACNQQALSQILTLFVPLDYQNFSFCRKHFRISNNINKLQLRINMEYYPSQPLTGNAGNPVQVDATGDNSIFLEQIYMSRDYFFTKDKPAPKINSYNFAINERCYNIMNTHTFYDPAMIGDPLYQWNSFTVNADTAMGMANVHENRYVGKAAYLFSFQPYAHSKNFLTGMDTRSAKAFDIIFNCVPDSYFQRAQTMYIYTCSNVIMEYGTNGIVNINK